MPISENDPFKRAARDLAPLVEETLQHYQLVALVELEDLQDAIERFLHDHTQTRLQLYHELHIDALNAAERHSEQDD